MDNKQVQVITYTDIESLALSVTTHSDDETIFALIKTLDEKMEDWNFTKECYRYFKNQMEFYVMTTKESEQKEVLGQDIEKDEENG